MIGPTKTECGWEYVLFGEAIEKRKGPKTGKITEHRSKFIIPCVGRTKKDAIREVAKQVKKPGVKLLPQDYADK